MQSTPLIVPSGRPVPSSAPAAAPVTSAAATVLRCTDRLADSETDQNNNDVMKSPGGTNTCRKVRTRGIVDLVEGANIPPVKPTRWTGCSGVYLSVGRKSSCKRVENDQHLPALMVKCYRPDGKEPATGQASPDRQEIRFQLNGPDTAPDYNSIRRSSRRPAQHGKQSADMRHLVAYPYINETDAPFKGSIGSRAPKPKLIICYANTWVYRCRVKENLNKLSYIMTS